MGSTTYHFQRFVSINHAVPDQYCIVNRIFICKDFNHYIAKCFIQIVSSPSLHEISSSDSYACLRKKQSNLTLSITSLILKEEHLSKYCTASIQNSSVYFSLHFSLLLFLKLPPVCNTVIRRINIY